ncbi:hypothetical protein [Clostridium sp. CF012]|uniref:hypothetical protein n=1 Tax=Clostridium sp. CF012 TaxID=2843319 RepID=UPI001C0B9039|nr:hypothetical protein [Clostridium sp. CF012]MBU3142512.1 hypothetical protein [Clostridium sp. CF012]
MASGMLEIISISLVYLPSDESLGDFFFCEPPLLILIGSAARRYTISVNLVESK